MLSAPVQPMWGQPPSAVRRAKLDWQLKLMLVLKLVLILGMLPILPRLRPFPYPEFPSTNRENSFPLNSPCI